MVLDLRRWLELRRFRPLCESGAMSLREIAKGTGLNRRTVSKYLKDPASLAPPKREAADQRPRRVVDEVAPLIDAMLGCEILLKGKVIHERLVQEYGVLRPRSTGETKARSSPMSASRRSTPST